MARRKQIIRYGISLGIDTTDMARGAREANTVTRRLNRDIGRTEATLRKYKHAQMQLRQEFKAGKITKQQFLNQLKKERLLRDRANGSLDKYRKRVRQETLAQKQAIQAERSREVQMRRLNAQRERAVRLAQMEHARRMQQMGGFGAGAASMAGFGGAAAGAARMGGNFGVELGGQQAAALVAGGLGMVGVIDQAREANKRFTEFESRLVDLKVLFGKVRGENLAEEFKKLAGSTALTTSQLAENAKIWASYGLTSENMTERLERLGTVAGGNSEKFRALTVAFAQVNAQGKLMGQEKNQLINAGFSLGEVAKVAGIEMKDFAKAMEDGAISADHVNEALVRMTEEGGLFYGLLEEKAKTLEGQAIITAAKWEEMYVAQGSRNSGIFKYITQTSGALADLIKHQTAWADSTDDDRIGMLYGITGSRVKGGKLSGSYSMTGTQLGAGVGTINTDGANQGLAYSFLDYLMQFDATARGGTSSYYKRGQGSSLDQAMQLALSGTLSGLGGRAALQGNNDPEKAKEDARKKREAERIAKEKAEKRAAQDLLLDEELARFDFQDPNRTGYQQHTYDAQKAEFDKMLADKKLSAEGHLKLINKMNAHFDVYKQNDAKREMERKAEEAEKASQQRAEKISGIMGRIGDQGKYAGSGMSRAAIALFEARDRNQKKIDDAQPRAGGQSGGVAGGGAEYAMLAERQARIDDGQERRKHEAWVKRKTEENNALLRKQLTELKKNNRLLEEPDKSGAV
jgi:tape measure domain-containing protein